MVDVPYCRRPEDVKLLPGAAEALRRVHELGYLAVVITNQSGIGRGLFTEDDLRAVNAELERQLAAEGARLDGLYYCPHLPTAGCACRKPETLLFERACKDLRIDPIHSYAVGDRGMDLEAALRIGSAAVLLKNSVGLAEAEVAGIRPAFVASTLLEFTEWLSSRPHPTR